MKRLFLLLTFGVVMSAVLNSCYYDKEEELYPNSFGNCDTTDTKYSTAVKKILDANCMGSACHSTGQLSYDFSSHAGVAQAANSGKLVSAIKQDGSASNMPKGGGKLSDCNIQIIESWVKKGALNN